MGEKFEKDSQSENDEKIKDLQRQVDELKKERDDYDNWLDRQSKIFFWGMFVVFLLSLIPLFYMFSIT